MTFGELLPRYLRHLIAERNASPYTVRNYSTDLRTFEQFLRSSSLPMEVDTVTRSTVRSYLGWLTEGRFARPSIARKKSTLRSFYSFLVREGFLATNPAAAISSPKLERRLPEFLGVEDARRLVESPDTSTPLGLRDRALLELLYASGLRVSEIVGLDMEQVDMAERVLLVRGKGSKERTVLMGRPAATAVQQYVQQGRPRLLKGAAARPLFITQYGKRLVPRRVQYLIDRYSAAAGLPRGIHPHMIRHTFATHLLDGNADLRVVQELLGHANLSSTEIYTHVSQSKARKVYLAAHPGARNRSE